MILDLTVFREETLDIKLMSDKTIHIPKPSQGMRIEVIKMKSAEDMSQEEAEAAVNRLVLKILNENTDGLTFGAEDIARLPEKARVAIVNAYADFIRKLQANPI